MILSLILESKAPMRVTTRALAGVAFAVALAGCSGDEDPSGAVEGGRPTVVVTTNILGEIVEELVGDEFQVVTIMPVGSDPHDFQASAQQVAQIGAADVVIVNGAGFEDGLLDVVEAAERDGVLVFEAISAIETIEFGASEHAEHDDDEEHDDEEHDDEEHDRADPHFFTDPARMALAAEAIVEFLIANVDGAVLEDAPAYVAELEALDTEVEGILTDISAERRVMVTNHEVFGYFADRYGFEVIGTVIPSGTTVDGASAQELVELAEVIGHERVPAIFADTSSSDELAATLAAEVGGIEVVELFSESLGAVGSGGETYLAMVRTNAERIAQALEG
jgi:zinc/manganese transport system substrate-binding protein